MTVTNTLTITPATLKLPVLSTANYSAILGTTPYTYSVFSGGGSTGCNTTLNGAITNATNPITVASTAGCPDRGVIYIESEQVCFSGKTATTFTGTAFAGTTVIRGCNGTTAAAHANGVAVNLARSVYTAPSTTGSATVRVTDNLGATSDSAVTIIKPVSLTMGHSFVCALYNEGSVKCWGENIYGQAGIGTATNIGDLGTEVGGANAFVNLGTGRTATKIVSGQQHVCAFLDNTTVKCWGYNAYGQLGQGNTSNVGNVSANDVANLSPINFGAKTPSDIWAFGYQTCVRYTDNTAVCWGLNTRGQSGQGSLTNITSPPATALNFGSSRYPTKMVGTASATCALLNDSSVQCWGENSTNGQLGNGTNTDLTAPSGTSINLGVGRTAVDLAGSASSGTSTTTEGHFCAALDDGTVKCWGIGNRGQVGDNLANTNNNTPVVTGTIGFNVSKIHTGREYSCAETSTGYFKCWGRNTRGQHLMGNTTQRDTPNYCRTTLTGAHTAVVTTITVGATTSCPSTNGKILIGTEIICYTGLTGTTFTGATRGCDGTTAAAYGGGNGVVGVMNFGTGVLKSVFDIAGSRSGCIISSSDRIKCWGNSLNAAGNAISGLFLYFTTSTATSIYIGDSTAELGDGLPFLNH
ncbi:hypothetical protein K2P97_00620 [bacterium]|nr:hypothetical protein [bacterium]